MVATRNYVDFIILRYVCGFVGKYEWFKYNRL